MKRLSPTAPTGFIALVALALVASAAVAPGVEASDEKARARAERATREGEYEAAEKIYRDLVAKDPRDSSARLGLSRALLSSGNFRLSVEEFRTALSFKNDEAMAIGGLAMVNFYENRISKSLTGLR